MITENVLTAMETIAKSVVDGVAYDKTITCTIVDDSTREQGKYIVTDGSSKFPAYSENKTYRNNTIVYVQVPNGDFTNQKLIIGKKTNDNTEPFAYTTPFDTFLTCTPNLIPIQTSNAQYALTANKKDDDKTTTQIEIFQLNDISKYYKNFDMLGIKADFQSWLRDENIKSGDYGLKLELTHRQKDVNVANNYADNPNSDEFYRISEDNGWKFEREYYIKDEYGYDQYSISQQEYRPNLYYYKNYILDTYDFYNENRQYYQYIVNENSFSIGTIPNENKLLSEIENSEFLIQVFGDIVCSELVKRLKEEYYNSIPENLYRIEYFIEGGMPSYYDIICYTYEYQYKKIKITKENYKPNVYYYIPKDKEYILSIDNGYNPNQQYFLKTPIPVNVIKDNFETLRDNGELRKYNEADNKLENVKDSGWEEGILYYEKKYSSIENLTEDQYKPNTYWIKNENSGEYYLDQSNGFTSGRQYYQKKKIEVKIANFEKYSTENNTYYRIDEITKNKVFLYNKINTAESEEKSKYEYQNVLKTTTTVDPTLVYYEDLYIAVNVAKDTYVPNDFYYISEEIIDKDSEEIIEKVMKLDSSNGWKENKINYYYKEDFGPISLTVDQYIPNKYYVLKEINGEDKYILSTGNGYNSKTTYYSKDDQYISTVINSTNYKAGKYYVRNSDELKEYTKVLYLSTEDMIGQPYAFSSFYNQQKTFDISDLDDITSLKLYFYERNNFISLTESGEQRYEPKDKTINNLFTKNIELYFGYDVSDIEDEYLQLFTYDPLNYQATTNSMENLKKIYLKWVHKVDDKTYMLDANNVDIFVQDELDAIQNYLDPSYEGEISSELQEYEMRVDESLNAIENRQYFERSIIQFEYNIIDAEDIPKISKYKKDNNEKGNISYGDIKFIQNQSADYTESREYYELGYWPKPTEESIDEILTSSTYRDKTYNRIYTNVETNEIYDPNTQYWLQIGPGELEELIPTEGFTFANTNQTYVKFTFVEESNPELEGEYVYGYKRINVNENTSKDILYNYYYLDFSPMNEDDPITSANFKVIYSPIDSSVYVSNKYYYAYIEATDIYEIRWYKYKLGAPSADEYSGVHWERIEHAAGGPEDATGPVQPIGTHLLNDFICELYPDPVYNKTEQVKVAIILDGKVYYSNIITFENNSDVIDVPNVEQEHALRVLYTDETKGNYYLYDESNALIDSSKASELRSIKLLFDLEDFSSGSLLKNASKVTWIFPLNNTMINVNTSATEGEYTSDGTYGYIINTGARELYELKYTIENYYGYTKNNNTITCNIEKDGVMYSTTAEMSFGQTGSNGTEYTLTLDLLSADHVVTWNPTTGSNTGENQKLYYLTYQEVDKEKNPIDFSGETIYYEQYVKESSEVDMLHWHGNPKLLYKKTDEGFELVNKKITQDENGKDTYEDIEGWNWDGGSLYCLNNTDEEITNDDYKVITLEEFVDKKDSLILYVKKGENFEKLNIETWWNYNSDSFKKAEKLYSLSDYINYREFNLDNYKEDIVLYTRDYYKEIDINEPNHYSAYYIKEDDNFIKVNIENAQQENVIVATLYDQNHNSIDISAYNLTWNWFYEQNCFNIEKKDNTSIYLQTKDKEANPENDVCILEATLSGFGDYNLTSYLPIPIRAHYGPVRFQGPTQIIYGASGVPNYYKDNINLYYNDKDGDPVSYPIDENTLKVYHQGKIDYLKELKEITNSETGDITDEDKYKDLLSKYNKDLKYIPSLSFDINDEGESFCRIVPMSLYVDGVKPFGIQCYYNGNWLWTQPILYMQNRYFSSTINQWDGNLSVDKDENTILAKMIGAGSKNSENEFSGVIMGDWTDNLNADNEGVSGGSSMLKHTGLYGFHEGETSFGFMDDGTGFIGKSGNGRILFDGNESTITSGNWENGKREGMFIDLDDGFLLMQDREGNYIKLNSLASGNIDTSTEPLNFTFPDEIPLPGEEKDSHYPFVVKGPKAFTAIGWSGDLLLKSKEINRETQKETNRGISINSSADIYPINVNNHYAIAWDGSMLISKKDISFNYTCLDSETSTVTLDEISIIEDYIPNSIKGIVDYIDNRRNIKDSNYSKNRYDYSRMNDSFKGLYATPLGDLYASKKVVVGDKFAVNNTGHLRATNALFEECNSDYFNVRYTEKVKEEDDGTTLSDIQYLEKYYGNDLYTPKIGKMGWLDGSALTDIEVEGETIPVYSLNLGISSEYGRGIKLNSSANLSIEAKNYTEDYDEEQNTIYNPNKSIKHNAQKIWKTSPYYGNIYVSAKNSLQLDGDQGVYTTSSKNISSITTGKLAENSMKGDLITIGGISCKDSTIDPSPTVYAGELQIVPAGKSTGQLNEIHLFVKETGGIGENGFPKLETSTSKITGKPIETGNINKILLDTDKMIIDFKETFKQTENNIDSTWKEDYAHQYSLSFNRQIESNGAFSGGSIYLQNKGGREGIYILSLAKDGKLYPVAKDDNSISFDYNLDAYTRKIQIGSYGDTTNTRNSELILDRQVKLMGSNGVHLYYENEQKAKQGYLDMYNEVTTGAQVNLISAKNLSVGVANAGAFKFTTETVIGINGISTTVTKLNLQKVNAEDQTGIYARFA